MGNISISDPDSKEPRVEYVFGGRLVSSEYVRITDEKNKETDVHKVHLDLVLTTDQFRELLATIGREPVRVMLV